MDRHPVRNSKKSEDKKFPEITIDPRSDQFAFIPNLNEIGGNIPIPFLPVALNLSGSTSRRDWKIMMHREGPTSPERLVEEPPPPVHKEQSSHRHFKEILYWVNSTM